MRFTTGPRIKEDSAPLGKECGGLQTKPSERRVERHMAELNFTPARIEHYRAIILLQEVSTLSLRRSGTVYWSEADT